MFSSDGASLSAEERQAADETTIATQAFDENRDTSDDSSSSSDDDVDSKDQTRRKMQQNTPSMTQGESSNRDRALRNAHNQSKLSLESDTWELLKGETQSDGKDVNAAKLEEAEIASWKSARNGGSQVVETVGVADGPVRESFDQASMSVDVTEYRC